MALAGAELIFFPSAEFDPTGDIIEAYLRSRSSENCLFVAFANRIGSEGKTNFFGRSQIISPYHGVLSRAARGGVAVTELDFATLNSARRKLPYLNERLPKAYSGLVANS